MAVAIKNMNLPNNCLECPLKMQSYPGSDICPFTNVECLNIGRQVNCPLEESDIVLCKDCEFSTKLNDLKAPNLYYCHLSGMHHIGQYYCASAKKCFRRGDKCDDT